MWNEIYEKADAFLNYMVNARMTIISGVFVLLSFICIMTETKLPFDLAYVSILISGLPLVFFAVKYLVLYKKLTSLVLISIGIIAAIVIGEVFAAAEIAFIMALGIVLEEKTAAKAQAGIRNLINLVPLQARKIIENSDKAEMVQADDVEIGDLLRVLPGENIPVDGKIVHGASTIDQSVLTGESLPVDVEVGDMVLCGTNNGFGSIDIVCNKKSEDSSLRKMINMVRDADNNQAPIQRIVDVWASWLIPIALLVAAATYLFTGDVVRAVTVLVVFCPCALSLATPTSVMAAIGQATKHGVLIKSGEALEKMGNVNAIAFDKTGTLTHGELELTDCVNLSHYDETHILTRAFMAEQRSEHPLAKSVVKAYYKLELEKTINLDEYAFSMIPGKGVQLEKEDNRIICGSRGFLEENNVSFELDGSDIMEDGMSQKESVLRKQGKALIYVAENGICIGILAFADRIRDTAQTMVLDVKKMGLKCSLLTGDNRLTGEYFAERVGIQDVYADLLPENKVRHVQQMQENGDIVCMIGDGVNDAPVLKIADVGVAMGKAGSDIAMEAADIALIGEDLRKIPYLKKLSIATIRSIKFNIAMALSINGAAVVFSILGWLGPVTGALVHNAGSILVVLNAARLYEKKIR